MYRITEKNMLLWNMKLNSLLLLKKYNNIKQIKDKKKCIYFINVVLITTRKHLNLFFLNIFTFFSYWKSNFFYVFIYHNKEIGRVTLLYLHRLLFTIHIISDNNQK